MNYGAFWCSKCRVRHEGECAVDGFDLKDGTFLRLVPEKI